MTTSHIQTGASADTGLRRTPAAGFTLTELMMVLAVIGLVLGFGLPAIMRWQPDRSINHTVSELVDVFNTARARAVLVGTTTTVIFKPRERLVLVEGAGSAPGAAEARPAFAGLPGLRSAVRIPDNVCIEMLDVNFIEFKDAEECRVRFFPNGTSEELTLVLRSDDGSFVKLWLELTTALPVIEHLR